MKENHLNCRNGVCNGVFILLLRTLLQQWEWHKAWTKYGFRLDYLETFHTCVEIFVFCVFHSSVPNPSIALIFIKSVNSEAISWQTYGMPLTQNVWITLICIAITITTLIYFSNKVMEKKKKSPVSALFIHVSGMPEPGGRGQILPNLSILEPQNIFTFRHHCCIDNVSRVVEFFWVAQIMILDCWPKIMTPKGIYRISPKTIIENQKRRQSKNKSWYLVFGKLLI